MLTSESNEFTEPLRLVIVEDDFLIYKTLKMLVAKHFPSIRIVGHCESVEEVIVIVGNEKPDILLLDIQLRGGTSFQALELLHDNDFEIIVMSAQGQFHYAQEAMRFGASKYLVKPFEPEDMIEALEHVIAKLRRKKYPVPTNVSTSRTTRADDQAEEPLEILRAVIVDDEKPQRAMMHRKLSDLFPELVHVVGEAFSVDSAIAVIQNTKPDVVFLDIDIIGGTGFDVMNVFPEPPFNVIFVTSHTQFAAQAFRYNTTDYLIKPVDPEHLSQAIDRVLTAREIGHLRQHPLENPSKTTHTSGYWTFKGINKTVHSLKFEHIIRLKADGKYTIVYHTQGQPIEIPQTLQECWDNLPEALFYRTHRSHVINRSYFSSARDYFAHLTNGERVDVSTRLWTQFLLDMGLK
jgi:two-component system LytT family response regulator